MKLHRVRRAGSIPIMAGEAAATVIEIGIGLAAVGAIGAGAAINLPG